MKADFQVSGKNTAALFTLKVHRGDGMALLGMNWRNGKPPKDFAGFAIEYKEPKGKKFFPLKNRLTFPVADGSVNPNRLSTLLSPIQKFRWVHFPRNAELPGEFQYRVTPVFMNNQGELSYGDSQEVDIELRRETYPRVLNVTFTRGFVSSQAFVDRYVTEEHGISTLIPAKADDGLDFTPTHPRAKDALAWMGFEARHAILEALDQATDAANATDEADLSGCALQRSGCTDQERALLFSEHQTGNVVAVWNRAGAREVEHAGVDDAERLVGVGLADCRSIGFEQEANCDDNVARLCCQVEQFLTVRTVVVG